MPTDHVLILGAGFAGLGMAIRLKQAGIDDFTVLEAAPRLGGTWRDNHYPGAACDIPSHLYSYSFEPWPAWSRDFARQPEILEYLEHCARKYGIVPHIRFGARADRARYDERTGTWLVTTTEGHRFQARVLISACGPLTRPVAPDLPGLSTFEGTMFHSSRWDHGVPLDGKAVAVIGTGASAIQIVPAIAGRVGHLTVFQRTPPWIVPKPDAEIAPWKKRLFRRLPIAQQLARLRMYWLREVLALGFVVEPRIMKLCEGLVRMHLRKSVPDADLRTKLRPRYRMGCKRILPTNDYYPALQRPNVELVTERIGRVLPHAIRTEDRRERSFDAIVLATGFDAAEQVAPFEVRGRSGRALSDLWGGGAEAYLGTAVAGFPNLFLLVGPNTGLGHNSMVFMIESQVAYVLDAIGKMRSLGLKSVEVRRETQERYQAALRRRLKSTVWMSGCMSWYLTRTGKNTTLWPGFTFEFRLRTRQFDARRYELEERSAQAPASTTSSRSLTLT